MPVTTAAAAASAPSQGVPLSPGEPLATPDEPRRISDRIQSLVDTIANLSLLEVADLNYALKKRLNLPDTPAFPVGAMMTNAAAAPAASTAPDAEGETAADIPRKMVFGVKLTKFDDAKKITLIKEIRNIIPGMNLIQAKKFIETAPVKVKEDLGKVEAEQLKATIENAGGVCEIV